MRKLLFLIIPILSLILIGCVTPEVEEKQVSVPKPEPKPELKIVGGINQEQPIPIGEKIYSVSGILEYGGGYILYHISYFYMGLDDKNNVKVIVKHTSRPLVQGFLLLSKEMKPIEAFDLILPLTSKKQALLKVKTLEIDEKEATWYPNPSDLRGYSLIPGGFVLGQGKELIITMVDEFSRITVEEIGETQTK